MYILFITYLLDAKRVFNKDWLDVKKCREKQE